MQASCEQEGQPSFNENIVVPDNIQNFLIALEHWIIYLLDNPISVILFHLSKKNNAA